MMIKAGSYSIHAVFLEYSKIEQEALLPGWALARVTKKELPTV